MLTRRLILLAVIPITGALTLVLPCAAQGLSISGKIRGPQGPLGGVTVTLRGASTGRRITEANGAGEYAFSGLDNGSYELMFEHPGYRTIALRVPLGYDPESGEVNVTLALE